MKRIDTNVKLSNALLSLEMVKLNSIDMDCSKQIKLMFEQDFVLNEELSSGSDITIEGIALQEGTFKGIHYSANFLKKVAKSFVGTPLRFDHEKGVRDIAGKILTSLYDPVRKAIVFTATVFNDMAKRIVKEGLVDSVSVGILVDAVRGKKGVEARDGVGKEISLVDVPACKTCKISKVSD